MLSDIPVPHLTTAYSGPLHHIEKILLNQVAVIEGWFRQRWRETPPPITSSVDLRHAGFKLVPVDTNLFPAGYNNLNPAFLPLCVQAAQSVLADYHPNCTKILIIPENHTRNQYYFESLSRLCEIFTQAGFLVKVGSLGEGLQASGVDAIIRENDRVKLPNFDPCLVVLNNDLSTGIPDILQNVAQEIIVPPEMGWSTRLKSAHFNQYNAVATAFSELVGIDQWLINPLFRAVDGIDFMSQEGLEPLAEVVARLLNDIRAKYAEYDIKEKPFVVVKADNGTYGMGVMMVYEAHELLTLNRKQRTKMSASKGSQSVSKVIVQEGVYSMETMTNGAVAEPVVYMMGQYVIGGFYRVHQDRGRDENLNAPGMHFEPLAFAGACNVPQEPCDRDIQLNRFYTYGVIARLAALAAALEIAAIRRN